MKENILHLKAPGNWINDPNGFIYYKGQYHLFYQHFPYAPVWGTMHWGHAVSDDLVTWKHLGVALFPTKDYDRNGIFSGSALEKDGKLFLYYSAVRYLKEQSGNIHQAEGVIETSQSMIISEDGFHFDNWKDKKQIIPVIRDPKIADSADTRDPKVWEENGRYYMILGSTENHQAGRLVLFSSEDGLSWKYLSQCTNAHYGHTMECPDLFQIDGKRVLIGSPMGIQEDGKEYANHSVCAFADFDPGTGKLTVADKYEYVDYGGDLYAPQSNVDKEGRRVMIAWMRMPEPVNGPDGQPWNGMMCFPREIRIQNEKICFYVHPEVWKYFQEAESAEKVLKEGSALYIKADMKEGESLSIGGFDLEMKQGCICTDRQNVFVEDSRYRTKSSTPYVGEKAQLDIFVEPNLIEIFVNQGQYTLSNVVYGLGSEISGNATITEVRKNAMISEK